MAKENQLRTRYVPEEMRTNPGSSTRHATSRSRRELGSVTIEFGITLLPLMALLMLIMDSAWAIFAQASLQEAAREGVRYAVTGQTGSGMCQDASIRSIVQQYSYGFIPASQASNDISIQYYLPSTLTAVSGVGSNAAGNVVQISISGTSVKSFGPIWRAATPVNVGATASDVMGPPPNNITPCR
jgi:hypothetical protein